MCVDRDGGFEGEGGQAVRVKNEMEGVGRGGMYGG